MSAPRPAPPGGLFEFSLYGVNGDDRVTACEHFRALTIEEAIRRAEARVPRFHKVEVWERSTCVFEALRPADAAAPRRGLLDWLPRLGLSNADS